MPLFLLSRRCPIISEAQKPLGDTTWAYPETVSKYSSGANDTTHILTLDTRLYIYPSKVSRHTESDYSHHH